MNPQRPKQRYSLCFFMLHLWRLMMSFCCKLALDFLFWKYVIELNFLNCNAINSTPAIPIQHPVNSNSKPINQKFFNPSSSDHCLTFSGQAHVSFQLFNGAQQLCSRSSSLQCVAQQCAGVLGSPVQTQWIIENEHVHCTNMYLDSDILTNVGIF